MDFLIRHKFKFIIGIISIFIITFSSIILLKKDNKDDLKESIIVAEELKDNNEIKEETIEQPIVNTIYVDVKGAVKQPGVYELSSDSKVIDAINIAGGTTKTGNTKYINLSKRLQNEAVIYVHTNTEIKALNDANKEIKEECISNSIDIKDCVDSGPSLIVPKPSESNSNTNNNSTNSTTTNKDTTCTTTAPEITNANNKINLNTADLKELTSLTGIGESKAQAIIQYRTDNGNFKEPKDITKVSGISEATYEKIKDSITV